MEETIKRQMIYLASWNMLKRLASDGSVDITLINKVNSKNAEMLMCDLLPID